MKWEGNYESIQKYTNPQTWLFKPKGSLPFLLYIQAVVRNHSRFRTIVLWIFSILQVHIMSVRNISGPLKSYRDI